MEKIMFILLNIIILSLMPKTLIILGIIYFTDWTGLPNKRELKNG